MIFGQPVALWLQLLEVDYMSRITQEGGTWPSLAVNDSVTQNLGEITPKGVTEIAPSVLLF